MATIGTPPLIQKTASTSIAPCVSPPSRKETFPGLNPNDKSPSPFIAITSHTRLSWSQFHKATSCATSTSRPTVCVPMISRGLTRSTTSSRLAGSPIPSPPGTNCPTCHLSTHHLRASSSGTHWTSPTSPPSTDARPSPMWKRSPLRAQRQASCSEQSTQ